MANTRQEIIDEVYFLLAEPSDSTEFDINNRVIPLINRVQRDVVRGRVVNETTGQLIKSPSLRFLRKKMMFTGVPEETLTAKASEGDTEIKFDPTDFEPSGYLLLGYDIVSYSERTADGVAGVKGINNTYSDSTRVKQVYKIPDNAWKGFRLQWANRGEYAVYGGGSEGYFINYLDYRESKSYLTYFTIWHDNASTGDNFIEVEGFEDNNDDRFIFYYHKDATDMTSDNDTTDLPDDYGRSVIAPIVAGKMLWKTDEAQFGKALLQQGYSELEQMYQAYNGDLKEYNQKVKSNSILQPYYYSQYGAHYYFIYQGGSGATINFIDGGRPGTTTNRARAIINGGNPTSKNRFDLDAGNIKNR